MEVMEEVKKATPFVAEAQVVVVVVVVALALVPLVLVFCLYPSRLL